MALLDTRRGGLTSLARPNSQSRTETGGKNVFPSSADHKQEWQPYPVDVQFAVSDDHTHCRHLIFENQNLPPSRRVLGHQGVCNEGLPWPISVAEELPTETLAPARQGFLCSGALAHPSLATLQRRFTDHC